MVWSVPGGSDANPDSTGNPRSLKRPHTSQRGIDAMGRRDDLAAVWPLYGLTITTPRLDLRLPAEADLPRLAAALAHGIQAPGTPRYQADWLYTASPERERKLLQTVYGSVARWTPDDWELGLAVVRDGAPIGMQSVFSRQFAATHGFGTGSWLALPHQGQGIGTEMGRAALALGFDGLGAQEAYIGAWADNPASLRVMEKLGYVFNGEYIQAYEGTARRDRRMRLPREIWESQDRDGIEISGLGPCLEVFGVAGEAGESR